MIHLIVVCKYRKNLLIRFGEEIKEIFNEIARKYKFEIIEMEVDKDHLHCLVSYDPNYSVTEVVKLFKQISTYKIWRQNDNQLELKKSFWKEKTFWSDGYFACSIGQVSRETIEKYIASQG